MLKRFTAVIFLLAVICGTSWGGVNGDPFRFNSGYVSSSDEAAMYRNYANTNANVFYQLRDITGASRSEYVAGPQWFATVYENYRQQFYPNENGVGIYRRTMGGETPDVPIMAVGDILDGFNFVFAEEPQPYNKWNDLILFRSYDVYPDPVESICIVTTNGQSTVNLRFANPYARHFPFWWNWTSTTTANNWSWWRNNYSWSGTYYNTAEPIAYIYSPSDNGIYTRGSTGQYAKTYSFVSSADYNASGDITTTHYYIRNNSGTNVLTLSGDFAAVSGDVHYYLDSRDRIAYRVSGDRIYDASNSLKYTIETDGNSDKFICEVRNINEAVSLTGLGSYYNVQITPLAESETPSGSYLDATIRISNSGQAAYGSRLGYLTFKQRASFMQGYTNYREASPLPIVVANVSSGNASTNPLIFDMIITDSADNVINRVKFKWDVQSDKNQDIGTFFLIQSPDATMPVYNLETRITNRTGTRYMLFRYDMINPRSADIYRGNYRNILPDYWKYDLTADSYGTLPERILLGAQSQIAPGLVTVYGEAHGVNASNGYTTLLMSGDTQASFRLYEYTNTTPRNLRLNYKRIRGMRGIGTAEGIASGNSGAAVRKFSLEFVDIVSNDQNTRQELYGLMGKPPVMATPESFGGESSLSSSSNGEFSASSTRSVNLGSSALAAFQFVEIVPDDLVSFRPVSQDTTSHDVVTSTDTTPNTETNTTPETTPNTSTDTTPQTQQNTSGDTSASWAIFTAATRESADIPLLPVLIRMRIPKESQLIVDHWNDFDAAESSTALLNAFYRYGTVWVRSEATGEKDTDLFRAINNKGSNTGVAFTDCVNAFLYNDNLYIDFIAVLADGKSTKAGMTAYVEIFKDDNIPYILIGDGNENGIWDLSFCVDNINRASASDSGTSNTNSQSNSNSGGGSGGGCYSFPFAALILLGMFRISRKR